MKEEDGGHQSSMKLTIACVHHNYAHNSLESSSSSSTTPNVLPLVIHRSTSLWRIRQYLCLWKETMNWSGRKENEQIYPLANEKPFPVGDLVLPLGNYGLSEFTALFLLPPS